MDSFAEDYWFELVRSAYLWLDPDLTVPGRLHESSCRIEQGACTCGAPLEVLRVGVRVACLSLSEHGAQVAISGFLPVWVERLSIRKTSVLLSDANDLGQIPEDYASWLVDGGRSPQGKPSVPIGGKLVFVRADSGEGQPWRWMGFVRVDGARHLLLVDPSLPLDRVFDASPSQVRTVFCGRRLPVSLLQRVG